MIFILERFLVVRSTQEYHILSCKYFLLRVQLTIYLIWSHYMLKSQCGKILLNTGFGIWFAIPSVRNLLSTVAKSITSAQSSILTQHSENPLVSCDMWCHSLFVILHPVFSRKAGSAKSRLYYQHASNVHHLENVLLVLNFFNGKRSPKPLENVYFWYYISCL